MEMLSLQLLFVFCFWSAVRLYVLEKRNDPSLQQRGMEFSPLLKDFYHASIWTLVEIWVYFCAGWLCYLGYATNDTLFQIVYLIFFLLFCFGLHLSVDWWRNNIRGFYTVVVVYSAVVLNLVYLRQFQFVETLIVQKYDDSTVSVHNNYSQTLTEILDEIGLRRYEVSDSIGIIRALLIPASFIFFVSVYLNFVHERFVSENKFPVKFCEWLGCFVR